MTCTDVVKEDLRNMGVDAWKEVVFDRNRWRAARSCVGVKD